MKNAGGYGRVMRPAGGWRSWSRLLVVIAALTLLAGGRAVLAQQAASFSVETAFDRARATVGDPIGLTVTVRYPAGAQVDTTGVEQQFAPFEILSAAKPVEQRAADGRIQLQMRYEVTAYQTGRLQLPALSVKYAFGSQAGTASSQPLPFTVDSVIPPGDPGSDIRPLKPPIEMPVSAPVPVRRYLTAALAGLGVLLLALLLWRLTPRRRSEERAAPPPVLSPLEVEAQGELDALVADGLLGRGDYVGHYARLAECIRRYIHRRYGFPAAALTTAELSERMVRSGVGRWRARLVTGLLSECDAVHYAHYIPAPARAEADLQMAYEIVDLAWSQETRPEEALPEVGARQPAGSAQH